MIQSDNAINIELSLMLHESFPALSARVWLCVTCVHVCRQSQWWWWSAVEWLWVQLQLLGCTILPAWLSHTV